MMASSNVTNENRKKLCETIDLNDSLDEPKPVYQPCITASDFEFEVSFEENSYNHNVSDLFEDSFSATMLEGPPEKTDKLAVIEEVDPDVTEIVEAVEAINVKEQVNYPMDGEKKYELQQTSNTVWELPNFKTSLPIYLDAESRDGTELCPLRTVLFKNGESIGLPTTCIANLYLKEWSDENQNAIEPNRNFKGDKRQEQQDGNPGKDLFMEVNMKLVDMDDSIPEQLIYTNFRARVMSLSTGVIATMGTPIFLQKLRSTTSSSVKVRWNLLKNDLNPEDPLFVAIHHYVYRSPSEWGLNPRQELIIKKFSESGEVSQDDAGDVQEILKKCEKANLTAVVDTLKAAGFEEN